MLFTVTVGGATRLTESGRSILERKPLTGVAPPLHAPAWRVEFDEYKARLALKLIPVSTLECWQNACYSSVACL
jgi:heme A synthase